MDIATLHQVIWGNSLFDYILSLGIFFGGLILIGLFKRIVLRKFRTLAKRTRMTLDDFFVDLIEHIGYPLSIFGVFYLSIIILTLDTVIANAINAFAITVLIFFGTKSIISIIVYGFSSKLLSKGSSKSTARSLNGILRIIKVVVWSVAIVFALDNLGLKISAVVAGLGIGGIAIGLAAQAILKDLFSYLAIILDQPFAIGDFIIVDNLMGMVEHIGIKTTRLRSLGGEQLVFSNTDLTDSRVRNYKRMERRRVLFKLGIVYQTSTDLLRQIPDLIKKIITDIPDAEFDRSHFNEFGDFSLNIETVFYVIGNDYNKYMDIMQKINLAIKEQFQNHSIEFAYPTQSIFIEKQ